MTKTTPKALTEFNYRIRKAREDSGLTQEELGAKVGLKQSAIDKLENRRALGSSRTVQIASACGVSPYWLASGAGERLIKELAPEAMAIGAAWAACRPATARDRFAHELLAEALNFLPVAHPWYKTASRLYRDAAKRRGIKVDLKQEAA